MPSNWNKGLTKENNISLKKTSETMRVRKLDNFKVWRDKMKLEGKIKSYYPCLKKGGDLAELIGVVLGDGHICIYPRTEELRLISNSDNLGFIKRYGIIIEKLFGKKAYTINSNQSKSTKIGFYEKNISKRINVASGARGKLKIVVPKWILDKNSYIVRYLRGLYEAEGSFSVHRPTYTHKFIFSNRNESMLNNVRFLLVKLGFHPHMTKNQVQISRKEEVYELKNLLKFRKY